MFMSPTRSLGMLMCVRLSVCAEQEQSESYQSEPTSTSSCYLMIFTVILLQCQFGQKFKKQKVWNLAVTCFYSNRAFIPLY